MIFQNAELYNVSEICPHEAGGYFWRRVPERVERALTEGGVRMNRSATGVELRFVLRSGEAIIRMASRNEAHTSTDVFHVYYGSIAGGWEDVEVDKYVGAEVHDFVIRRPGDPEMLRRISRTAGHPFSPDVIRVIFDRGQYRLLDIIGDVEPPTAEQLPKRSILFYGSSITHGSNSIDQSHSFASRVGARLGMDVRNLGFAGSCALEPEMATYLAEEGQRGGFDMAVLELGINVSHWEEPLIRERSEYLIRTVAAANPEKPILVISPFFSSEDLHGGTHLLAWRRILQETVEKMPYPNLTYVNGLSLLGAPSLLSADLVHPSIEGVDAIADGLTAILRKKL